jgi:hypothetical protein
MAHIVQISIYIVYLYSSIFISVPPKGVGVREAGEVRSSGEQFHRISTISYFQYRTVQEISVFEECILWCMKNKI